MDAFLPSVLNSPMDILENSDLIINSFCSDLKSSNEPVTSNVDLHLECEEDGGSISMQAGSDFYLSHEFIGENIQLAISFPNPSSSSVPVGDSISCNLCNSMFNRQQLLFKHLKEAHDVERSYSCDICTYAGSSSRLLSRHKMRKHSLSKEKKPNTILADVEDSRLKGSLLPDKVFLNTSVGKHPFDTNTIAERIINVNKHLSLDKNLHIATDMIECKNAFDDKSTFDDKNTCTDNLRIYQLDTAISEPAVTIMKQNTLSHNEITSGYVHTKFEDSFKSTPFECFACVYTATSKRLLMYHINTKHNPRRQLFQCMHCHYTCRQKRTLDLHILKHTGSEAYICHHCQKNFFSLFALRRHLLIHTDEKRFQCSIHACLKAFKTAGALGDHKRKVHCVKAQFVDKNFLEDPAKVVCPKKQVKKVMCGYHGCGKTFRDRSNLKTHQCLHSGDKPIKCSLCSFSCVQKTSLNYHNKKCHML